MAHAQNATVHRAVGPIDGIDGIAVSLLHASVLPRIRLIAIATSPFPNEGRHVTTLDAVLGPASSIQNLPVGA